MALNFGLLGDAGAPAMGYLQGQQDVTRNQLAQQQIQTGQLNQQKAQMETIITSNPLFLRTCLLLR
jgi:hypothetical protein